MRHGEFHLVQRKADKGSHIERTTYVNEERIDAIVDTRSKDGGETYCTIYVGETGIFTLRGSAKEIVEAGWKSKEV